MLRTTGVQSEAQLPFAGLHLLVVPMLDPVERRETVESLIRNPATLRR